VIVEDILGLWACLAAMSVAADAFFTFRALTGRDGEECRAHYLEIAARHGGVRRWIVMGFVFDIFEPWLMWTGLFGADGDEWM
jgi:hypothetical protein